MDIMISNKEINMENLTREDLKIFRNLVDKQIDHLRKQYNQLEFGEKREKIMQILEDKEDLWLRISKDLIEMPEDYQGKHEIRIIDQEFFDD